MLQKLIDDKVVSGTVIAHEKWRISKIVIVPRINSLTCEELQTVGVTPQGKILTEWITVPVDPATYKFKFYWDYDKKFNEITDAEPHFDALPTCKLRSKGRSAVLKLRMLGGYETSETDWPNFTKACGAENQTFVAIKNYGFTHRRDHTGDWIVNMPINPILYIQCFGTSVPCGDKETYKVAFSGSVKYYVHFTCIGSAIRPVTALSAEQLIHHSKWPKVTLGLQDMPANTIAVLEKRAVGNPTPINPTPINPTPISSQFNPITETPKPTAEIEHPGAPFKRLKRSLFPEDKEEAQEEMLENIVMLQNRLANEPELNREIRKEMRQTIKHLYEKCGLPADSDRKQYVSTPLSFLYSPDSVPSLSEESDIELN